MEKLKLVLVFFRPLTKFIFKRKWVKTLSNLKLKVNFPIAILHLSSYEPLINYRSVHLKNTTEYHT